MKLSEKLSNYANEDALDLLADLLDPVSVIFSDQKLIAMKNGSTKMDILKYVIKNYKAEIVAIMARIEGVDASEYKVTFPQMLNALMDLVNDKELVGFFS